jgi:hypothetical protein
MLLCNINFFITYAVSVNYEPTYLSSHTIYMSMSRRIFIYGDIATVIMLSVSPGRSGSSQLALCMTVSQRKQTPMNFEVCRSWWPPAGARLDSNPPIVGNPTAGYFHLITYVNATQACLLGMTLLQ